MHERALNLYSLVAYCGDLIPFSVIVAMPHTRAQQQ
jgi:hypothetical protein